MYVGCNVESSSDPSLNVCAERTVLLKAVSDGEVKFQGLVVCTDQSAEFPVPDGGARQFLSEYGDFPVFVVNRDLEVQRYTTFQLFPMAQSRSAGNKKTTKDEDIVNENRLLDDGDDRSDRNPREWSVGDVLKWLDDEVNLGQYRKRFSQSKVDGALLLQMVEGDLERYGVDHALHRRKILAAISGLRDEDVEENVDLDDLDEYLTTLDEDRVRLNGGPTIV